VLEKACGRDKDSVIENGKIVQPMIKELWMSGLLETGPVFAVTGLLADIGLDPAVLVIAMICAGLGTLILSRHTFQLGMLTYPLNFAVLFGGAVAANLLLQNVRLPVDSLMERAMIISIGGMVVASLILILLIPKDRQSG
jgi:hypothetical protein